MIKTTLYGYARVSTNGQDYKSQIKDLMTNGVKRENIFVEKYTGTTTARPVFSKLIKKLHKGDTLVVVKLDRLARNTKEALELVDKFNKQGITLNVLNIGKIDNTPVGKLIFTVFSAFAQFERDMILDRTNEGKEYAKKHNPYFKEGRPKKYTQTQLKEAYRLRQVNHWTMDKTAKETKISVATLYRAFREFNNKQELETNNKKDSE